MKIDSYMCNRCYGQVTKKLVEDEPGFHVYRWVCKGACKTEYGSEWRVHHHGPSETPPVLNLLRWPHGKEANVA